MPGTASQPRPWWQPSGGYESGKFDLTSPAGARGNLEASAPDGYEYDPVKMAYVRQPAAAGSRLKAFTDASMPDSLKGLIGGFGTGGVGGAGGIGGPTTGPGGGVTGAGAGIMGGNIQGGGFVPPIQAPDMTQANDAIFARAKDQVGKLSRASIDSLAGELGSQNMLGSGAQVQGIRDITQAGMGELGDVSRSRAIEESQQKADFAKTGYQGAITQRGQNIAAQEAQARLALEARQQQMQLLETILGSLRGNTSGTSSFLY